jgi:hypothetical protein
LLGDIDEMNSQIYFFLFQTEQPNVETPNERENSIVLKRKYLTLKVNFIHLKHKVLKLKKKSLEITQMATA